MRIIGGDYRGRKLASLGKGDEGARLRPTSDRVRESLFNILRSGYGAPADGARVLDLFAGTGALGLEALSRGAQHVTFIENGRTSLRLLKENIRLCGAPSETKVLTKDARRLGANPDAPYDLIFLDPPYGKSLGEVALDAALNNNWIANGAVIVWEESAAITVPEELSLSDQRRYGDTVISILERPL